MKAIVNFENHSITVSGEICNFEEAGIYCNPANEEYFITNDCDNHLSETKGVTEIEYC